MDPASTHSLNRRQMILGSGVLLAGISQTKQGAAQVAVEGEKDLIFRTTDPRNAEPALNKLIESWITPTERFYVRSHAPNPVIDQSDYRLAVEGMVDRELSLSIADLTKFKEYDITATLTCAGNRRAEFNAEGKVGGVQWEAGAIGNATWTGVSLDEVLKLAGIKDGAKHVWFEGLDEIAKEGPNGEPTIPFGASIPLEKLAHQGGLPGAMLVYKMNGKPLTADHGFPLRTLVPGYIGARSVKWVGRVIVSDTTSPNHYLATAYKLVKKTDPLDWSEAGPIYRYLVNAAIGSHGENTELSAGNVSLAGYVLPSGLLGAKVTSVEVSIDGGDNWQETELHGDQQDYCWQLWKTDVTVSGSTKEILVRAKDNAGGFMPERVPWNAKGYLQNSWYRLPVTVN